MSNDPAKFLEYMKIVENAALMNGGELLHESPEGGLKTWGYGHKLRKGEDMTGKDPDEVLVQDLQRHWEGLVRKDPSVAKLPKRSQEMLLDMEFNLGDVREIFPTFYQGVKDKDIDVQRREYKRYFTDPKTGKPKEVRDRNQRFYDRYLSPQALKRWSRGP